LTFGRFDRFDDLHINCFSVLIDGIDFVESQEFVWIEFKTLDNEMLFEFIDLSFVSISYEIQKFQTTKRTLIYFTIKWIIDWYLGSSFGQINNT
jgi:hypothetical protein